MKKLILLPIIALFLVACNVAEDEATCGRAEPYPEAEGLPEDNVMWKSLKFRTEWGTYSSN